MFVYVGCSQLFFFYSQQSPSETKALGDAGDGGSSVITLKKALSSANERV